MSLFEFKQVDVFSSVALKGNPVAVVLNADSLSDAQMADFARWTNLSETTFVLKPQNPEADYRLRIFTTLKELPFAGHPTLGSCHAWLEAGGQPKGAEVVQECSAGLIRIRRQGGQLAFTAPPLLRTGAVEEALLQRICRGLGIEPQAVAQARWVDNGPGWVALMLRDRKQVLDLEPDYSQLLGLSVGVVAPWQPECRAGAVADCRRSCPDALCSQPGYGHGPGGAGVYRTDWRRYLGGRSGSDLYFGATDALMLKRLWL